MRRTGLIGIVAGIVLALPVGAVRGDEYYFGMVFGSQSRPKLLRYTHTWATFIRAVGEGPDLNTYQLYVHTISWMPRSGVIRVWASDPEPGVNLELVPTLQAVYANREHVTMWGPFVLTRDVYERSLYIWSVLQGGAVQYRAISGEWDMLVSDCIHAVAAVDPIFGRDHYPLIRIGVPASRFIAREVMVRSLEQRGFNQAESNNSWLISRLGLDAYPIEVVPPQQIPLRRCFLCRCPP